MANEKRLIDATRLRFEANRFFRNDSKVQDDVDGLICMMPTVDAVEVVRCKDCTSWCQEKIARLYGVDRFCTMTGMLTNADDFCSYGERRIENDE